MVRFGEKRRRHLRLFYFLQIISSSSIIIFTLLYKNRFGISTKLGVPQPIFFIIALVYNTFVGP